MLTKPQVSLHKPNLSDLGTAGEYVKAIAHHSQQSGSETLYPGEIYDTLKRFLEQRSDTVSHATSDFAWLVSPSQLGQQASTDRQPTIDRHSLSDNNKGRGQSMGYSDPESCMKALRMNIETSHPQVLFLRGHPSPNWLSSIGAFCYADPELFRWFIRYRGDSGSDHYFDAAPSVMSNIFRFKFFTIGAKTSRNQSSQKIVDNLREKAASEFQSYQNDLRGTWGLRTGDSIVRGFYVLDERHCVIEQEIVISIFDIGKTWMGTTFATAMIEDVTDDYSSYCLY